MATPFTLSVQLHRRSHARETRSSSRTRTTTAATATRHRIEFSVRQGAAMDSRIAVAMARAQETLARSAATTERVAARWPTATSPDRSADPWHPRLSPAARGGEPAYAYGDNPELMEFLRSLALQHHHKMFVRLGVVNALQGLERIDLDRVGLSKADQLRFLRALNALATSSTQTYRGATRSPRGRTSPVQTAAQRGSPLPTRSVSRGSPRRGSPGIRGGGSFHARAKTPVRRSRSREEILDLGNTYLSQLRVASPSSLSRREAQRLPQSWEWVEEKVQTGKGVESNWVRRATSPGHAVSPVRAESQRRQDSLGELRRKLCVLEERAKQRQARALPSLAKQGAVSISFGSPLDRSDDHETFGGFEDQLESAATQFAAKRQAQKNDDEPLEPVHGRSPTFRTDVVTWNSPEGSTHGDTKIAWNQSTQKALESVPSSSPAARPAEPSERNIADSTISPAASPSLKLSPDNTSDAGTPQTAQLLSDRLDLESARVRATQLQQELDSVRTATREQTVGLERRLRAYEELLVAKEALQTVTSKQLAAMDHKLRVTEEACAAAESRVALVEHKLA